MAVGTPSKQGNPAPSNYGNSNTQYRLVKASRDNTVGEDEVRITSLGRVNEFVEEAICIFTKTNRDVSAAPSMSTAANSAPSTSMSPAGVHGKEAINIEQVDHKGPVHVKIMARGTALAKAVIVAEILCRRVPDLTQTVELGATDMHVEFEPVETDADERNEGDKPENVMQTRIVPSLIITLTSQKVVRIDDIKEHIFVRRPRLVTPPGGRSYAGGRTKSSGSRRGNPNRNSRSGRRRSERVSKDRVGPQVVPEVAPQVAA